MSDAFTFFNDPFARKNFKVIGNRKYELQNDE